MKLRPFAIGLPILFAGTLAAVAIPSQPQLSGPSTPEQGDCAELLQLRWGYLIDVYARDPRSGRSIPVARDLVAAPTGHPAGKLEVNPVTGIRRLHLPLSAGGTLLAAALEALDAGLVTLDGASPDVPPDAALVLSFDRDLDRREFEPETVRLLAQGEVHPVRSFIDPRDARRLVIDLAVSELEAELAPRVLEPSPAGPPLAGDGAPNLELELASGPNPARGLARGLAFRGGARLATSSPMQIALRASTQSNPADADLIPPQVLGAQIVQVGALTPLGGADYSLDLVFGTAVCSQAPVVGDVVRFAQHVLEVSAAGTAPVGGALAGVQVQLLRGQAATLSPGPAVWLSTFDAALDVPGCFVQFAPAPGSPPTADVDPTSAVGVRFTEPIDPGTAVAHESLKLTSVAAPGSPHDYAPGLAWTFPGKTGAVFAPALPLNHVTGSAETWFFEVTSAVTDRAGNPLVPFPQVAFTLDPTAPDQSTGGFALRFHGPDEDGDGLPEMRGQLTYDSAAGTVSGRPVSRFSSAVDQSQLVPSLMIPFRPGLHEPLNPLGARLMKIWRYLDAGLTATDEDYYNLDVEHLWWSPVGDKLEAETFPEFEISLGHSHYFPDEVVSPTSLLPTKPQSGLTGTSFADNVSGTMQVVHPRSLGYTIDPIDLALASSGNPIAPYPLNRSADPATHQYFTWRDTAQLELGAPNGNGIEPKIAVQVGLALDSGRLAYKGFVPTFGLPLLTEIRCFPTDTTLGLNSLDVSIAINSSSKPSFRAYSAGGFNTAGQPVVKNPDLELVPSGGFSPASFPPGQPTPGTDNVFYEGQVDFVVRVSRAHSRWFDTGSDSPDYAWVSGDPSGRDLPAGTSLELAFRGATKIETVVGKFPLLDASQLDAYGDLPELSIGLPGDPAWKNAGITFLGDDSSWKSDLDDLDGARFVQVRVTFVGNPASGLGPVLDTLQLGFQD